MSMQLWMRLKNSSFVQALSDKKGTLPGPINECLACAKHKHTVIDSNSNNMETIWIPYDIVSE